MDSNVAATTLLVEPDRPAPGWAVAGRVLQRLFDVTFAVVALVLTAPLLLLTALLIRLESPGPALFRQTRMAKGGGTFQLVKFRGMYADARERFPELYAYDAISADENETYFFHGGDAIDPRVTKVGRLIRRWSIDELPNFWNVLVGDMSIVGPRPEIPELQHLYGERLAVLLSVKPGLTSPAKAKGRDDLSLAQTIEMDLDYIARRSFRRDLITVVQTVMALGRRVR